jgi:hypothetical protein
MPIQCLVSLGRHAGNTNIEWRKCKKLRKRVRQKSIVLKLAASGRAW